ncbi:cytochrome c6, chloroplastic-like isoform X1 [Lolium rigidum]|uniref:cytochrome c6, chloroplastic-like isoform X1 n=1 Tax=Lolium rigidum TaxID=89674 RepID=UPI001F5D85F2|nr:cytochrome c6, chloroplastic-like isoform X1 [Lolium rigidum]
MHQLPLAARPPAPRPRSFQRRAACRCSLKQASASLAVAVRQCAAAPLLAATLLLGAAACPDFPAATPPAFAQSRGAALFQKACIGCHDTGGNILQPGATLSMKDLERNGVATEEEIYNITYYGKGRMPGYGEKCTPRGQCTFGPRLPEEDIKMLAAFVKSQAENGWPKIDSDVE